MANVILTKPLTHNDEDLKPGDPIFDLTEKDAARLVALGVAKRDDAVGDGSSGSGDGDDDPSFTPPVDDDDAEEEPEEEVAEDSRYDGVLSDEERAEIKAMPKATVMENLTDAGVEFKPSESVAKLREKLMQAWSEPAGDGE